MKFLQVEKHHCILHGQVFQDIQIVDFNDQIYKGQELEEKIPLID